MYEITGCPAGRLATMPRPRGDNWLPSEIRSLKGSGVTDLVSLLTLAEEIELALLFEAQMCEEAGINFHRFAVVDRDVPPHAEFEAFINSLLPVLRNNGFIAIHCRAGIGRSTVIAAGLLVGLGVAPEQALKMISQARGFDVPDTEAQLNFILGLGKR